MDVSNESNTTANSILKDRVEPEFKMRVPKSAKLPNLVPNIPIVKTKDGKVLLSVPDLEAVSTYLLYNIVHSFNLFAVGFVR